MSLAGQALSLVRNQARNAGRLLSGRPLCVPALAAGTLEPDDAALARSLLADRSRWRDRQTVAEFEQRFAQWNGSRHAFALMGGRVALSAIIEALGLGPGDEVILPGYTCVVVPNAFEFAGVDMVYADIELQTYGLDVEQLEARITPRTRAIVLQHLYGLVCRDYEAIVELAEQRGLYAIEDCAQAMGAELHGRKVGTRGHVALFSLEQSKPITTIMGGLAVTDDDVIAKRLAEVQRRAPVPDDRRIDALLHNVLLSHFCYAHPQRWLLADAARLRYGHKELDSTTIEEVRGQRPAHYGQNMPGAIAELGLNQLRKIDRFNARRRETATRWDRWCDENGYQRPLVAERSTPVFLRYPVLVEPGRKRDRRWAVETLGVEPGGWFVSQRHPAPAIVPGCPNGERAVKCCINFPTLT